VISLALFRFTESHTAASDLPNGLFMDVVSEYRGWRFEWDAEKGAKNLRDHGVTFEHAAKAFRDGESLVDPDYMHSITEERWVNLGLYEGRLLTVCVNWRETADGETSYRIISAHELSAKNVLRYRRRHLKKN
jgi:uncharacterized DUF497 family protein